MYNFHYHLLQMLFVFVNVHLDLFDDELPWKRKLKTKQKNSVQILKKENLTGSFPLNQRIFGNVWPMTLHIKSILSPGKTNTWELFVDIIGGSEIIFIWSE